MNLGTFIVEQERQEAVERALARYKAEQSREQRRVLAGKRSAGLGRGARRISREEALAKIAKTHPRSAWKLLQGYFGARVVR